jgi:DNA-directed RNA polymerase subunit M/transcription elongation factor TFIIS
MDNEIISETISEIISKIGSDLCYELCDDFSCSINTLGKEILYWKQKSPMTLVDQVMTKKLFWNVYEVSMVHERSKAMFIQPESSGIIACICGSFKTTTDAKQTRSGDESMTVFVSCLDCGRKWKM